MILKTLQWNIGGGRIRTLDSDETKMASYDQEGLPYIIEKIKALDPDIITLQETHASGEYIQAKEAAAQLGYEFVNDIYNAQSHVDKNFGLGQAILSRFKIYNHEFSVTYNPKLRVVEEETGDVWTSHDKGITSCVIELSDGAELVVQTLHSVPLRRFEAEPQDEQVKLMLDDIDGKIKSGSEQLLVQGDFNIDQICMRDFFPKSFTNSVEEVPCVEATNPKGYKYDHVLYKGLRPIKNKIINDVLTDHYPVYSEFEI